MTLLINGEVIPDDLISDEEQRLGKLPEWQGGEDQLERKIRLRQAAEHIVIDRILLRQEADVVPR